MTIKNNNLQKAKKDKSVTFRISHEDLMIYENYCLTRKMKVSEFIRSTIKNQLNSCVS
jgi:predicted DNA binding CopG/RHH family protein